MNSRHHKRHLSNAKTLPAHARPSRPAALTKRTSYNHAASRPSSNLEGPNSSNKATSSELVRSSNPEDEDMASFPQFCTTCDKQIITPNFTLLYCSEACRRKDTQLNSYTPLSPPLSPSMPPTHHEFRHHDIVPQRSPTIVRPLSNTFSDLSLSSNSSRSSTYEEDEDESAGVQDLPGFPYGGLAMALSTTHSCKRASTATDAPPSLVHSPSSSYGTVASFTSARPLPPRQQSYVGLKSIELVAPHATAPTGIGPQNASLKSQASTLTSLRVAEADTGREAQAYSRLRKSSLAAGSLQQLFSHEAIRAAPR